MPPWQPVRVVREAPSVRDGQAVLLSTGGRQRRHRLAALDRDRRPARRLPARGDRPRPERAGQRGRARRGAQRRLSARPGPGAAQARAAPGPPAGPRLLLGAEGARELAKASQRVTPAALSAVGHRFRYPKLDGALRHVLGREPGPAAPAGQGR